MEQLFEIQYEVAPSLGDYEGRLSYQGAFSLLMDLATAHAERLGVGLGAMREKSLFWLAVRARIVFYNRPSISEQVRLLTWPEKPAALRCNRSYEMRRGEELLLRGRTEWAVFNTETKRLVPSAGIFPPALSFERGPTEAGAFCRIPERFEGFEPFAAYTVRSTDIDLGGHMNNAAYPRAVLSAFTLEELKRMDIRTIDMVYRAPCYEGDELRLFRREEGDGLDLRALRGEETVLMGRITMDKARLSPAER